MESNRARWARVEELFHAAAERPPAERERFLADACGRDAELRREVESLLAEPSAAWTQPTNGAASGKAESVSLIGSRVGVYQVTALLGAGGMGQVYRARDTRLGREVAIKILPPVVTADPDRLARFEREARVLASLNHPNIATIYGVEEADGLRAIAMELVAGHTLADCIARGPMPIADARAIARQILDALEAAHERGVIHRDIKPANVIVTPEGVVKVLDFGLAKALPAAEAQPRGAVHTHAPTLTADRTYEGLVMGTAAYMSPEQARGQIVDRRTDVWAFGCVLFEMLTGRKAFAGGTISDILAAVLEREPDWSLLPAAVPRAMRRLLRRCLEKDSRRRLRDVGDVRLDLDEDDPVVDDPVTVKARSYVWRGIAVTAGLAAVAFALFAVYESRRAAPDSLPVEAITQRLTFDPGLSTSPAVSANGQLLAYSSNRSGRGDFDIWVQQTGGGAPLRLTDDPADDLTPAFSPDGAQIAFRSERAGGGIYLISALGGEPRLVVAQGRGPQFSPDGRMLAYWSGQFRGSPSGTPSELYVVPLNGGTPTRLVPSFVMARDAVWTPDSKALIFLGRSDRTAPLAQSYDWWRIGVDGGQPVNLHVHALRGGIFDADLTGPSSWSPRGVLFAAAGSILRVPPSLLDGRGIGTIERLTTGPARAVNPVAAPDGSIVFGVSQTRRVIERASLTDPRSPPIEVYSDSRVIPLRASETPDGNLIVIDQDFQSYREIWLRDMRTQRQRLVTRVTATTGVNATISPDGRRICYTVERSGPGTGTGYVVDVAGGVPHAVCENCTAYAFLSDSSRLLAVLENEREIAVLNAVEGAVLVRMVAVDADRRVNRPLASPDDRWLAFRAVVGPVGKSYVIPLRDRLTPPQEWRQIDEPTTTGRPAGWSPDSSTLYLLLDNAGLRGVWAQKIERGSGQFVGPVSLVREFHTAAEAGPSTSYGNPVTTGGLLYERLDVSGDLWRLSFQRSGAADSGAKPADASGSPAGGSR